MNPGLYFIVMFLPLFVILMQQREHRRAAAAQIILNNSHKSKEDTHTMLELAKKLLGHEVNVVTLNGEQLTGTLAEISDCALLIDGKRETNVVNVNYIIRIREAKPKN